MRSFLPIMHLDFFVSGRPKAQPRVKAFRRGNHAGVYTPDSAESWKQAVRLEAIANAPESVVAYSVRVELDFFLPRPKAHYKRDGSVKGWASIWHDTKPDLDNLIKAVTDAITDTQRIWSDDRLICQISATKSYADSDSGCRVRIHAD